MKGDSSQKTAFTEDQAMDEEPLEPIEAEEAEPLDKWHLGKRRLIYTALTSSSVGLVLSAVLALLSQTVQFVPDDLFENTFDFVVNLGIF